MQLVFTGVGVGVGVAVGFGVGVGVAVGFGVGVAVAVAVAVAVGVGFPFPAVGVAEGVAVGDVDMTIPVIVDVVPGAGWLDEDVGEAGVALPPAKAWDWGEVWRAAAALKKSAMPEMLINITRASRLAVSQI